MTMILIGNDTHKAEVWFEPDFCMGEFARRELDDITFQPKQANFQLLISQSFLDQS